MSLSCMLGPMASLNPSIDQEADVAVDLVLVEEVVWGPHTTLVGLVAMLQVAVRPSATRDVHQTLIHPPKAGHPDGTPQERQIHMLMEERRLRGMQVRGRLILMLMVVKHQHGTPALGHQIHIAVEVVLPVGAVRLLEGMSHLPGVRHGVVPRLEERPQGGVRVTDGRHRGILVGQRLTRRLG